MHSVYLALGSNIEPREHYLKEAIRLLNVEDVQVVLASSIYETEPVGYTDQSEFLNMVVEARTKLSPFELLETCQRIEKQLGRKREIRWGPRTVDIDILLYNNEVVESEGLTIPHPRMHERGFVLVPLHEIAASQKHSMTLKSVEILLEQLPRSEKEGIRKFKN